MVPEVPVAVLTVAPMAVPEDAPEPFALATAVSPVAWPVEPLVETPLPLPEELRECCAVVAPQAASPSPANRAIRLRIVHSEKSAPYGMGDAAGSNAGSKRRANVGEPYAPSGELQPWAIGSFTARRARALGPLVGARSTMCPITS